MKRARENINVLSPRLSALRKQAKAAHDAGRLDESENLVSEIARAERRALKRLTEHAHKILEEVKLCKRLATALGELGVRERGTEKLEEAVSAFREALTEYTREQVSGDWAGTQMNLGRVLLTLGKREGGTGKLEEAVSACREALKEWTPEATPYWHDITQKNLDEANALLAERHGTGSALIGCQEIWLQKSDHKKPILQRVQFRLRGTAIGAPPPFDSNYTKNPADLI